MSDGQLLLAAVPIGNPRDASARLIEAMQTADIVAAEDTRRAGMLASKLGLKISGRLVSFHDHNERDKVSQLLDEVEAGKTVLVISDAGMPLISDPGFRIQQLAIERDLPSTVLPGPSAVLTALVHSGLPTDRFTFEGFLPPKDGKRRNYLTKLSEEERTMIFFESPHRITKTLVAMRDIFGEDRKAALCRELTKHYEDIWRGTLTELASRAETSPPKGEICVVVAGVTGVRRAGEL